MKPAPSYPCPICEKGKLTPKIGDYNAILPDGGQLIVKNVHMDICDFCGEIALGEEAAEQIDAAIADHNESPSTKELVYIRKTFQVSQNQMSEILGLGGKTWNRWETGVQYPSRSMGFYLRVLHQFPQAFDWLKIRAWKIAPANRLVSSEVEVIFPSLASRGHVIDYDVRNRESINAARALFCVR